MSDAFLLPILAFFVLADKAWADPTAAVFAQPGIFIPEAPSGNILQLSLGAASSHPRIRKRQQTIASTIFDGVYPVVNLTWGNKDGTSQTFLSFIDTG